MKQLKKSGETERVDKFIERELGDIGRRRTKELFTDGRVRLNGKSASPGARVTAGDIVEVSGEVGTVLPRPKLVETTGGPEAHLEILHQDDAIFIISKPRAMHSVVHRLDDPITVADCLAALDEKTIKSSNDPREAGLVQRLDYYTSGLLVAARSGAVWTKLHREFAAGRVAKTYLAMVSGKPRPEFVIRKKIETPKNSETVKVSDEDDSPSRETIVTVIDQQPGECALVRISGKSFSRHQIRAHLAYAGHPLIGDTLYGATQTLSEVFGDKFAGDTGFLLHAESITFSHPVSSERISFKKQASF